MCRKAMIIAMVFGFTMILFTGSGWAGCDQKDLEGTWSVQISRGDLPAMDDCWDECTLTIGPDGIIEEGGTYIPCGEESSQIVGGQLSLCPGRIVRGTILTSNGTLNIARGAITAEHELVLGVAEE